MYLDARDTPMEERTLRRLWTKLDYYTNGSHVVVEVSDRSMVVEVEGTPERVSRDGVVRSPHSHKAAMQQPIEAAYKLQLRKKPRNIRRTVQDSLTTKLVSETPSATRQAEEFVIDSLLSRGVNPRGLNWALV